MDKTVKLLALYEACGLIIVNKIMEVKQITISQEVSKLEDPVEVGVLLNWDRDYAGFVSW